MDSKKIQFIIIGILATFVAIYLGVSAATAQNEAIAWVIGSAVVITCVALGRKIWLLIPFMTAFGISLRLPGQPSSILLAQILVLGFCVLLFLTRKLPLMLAWTELETWILVLTVFVGQVYLRHPVGVNLFGGDSVGGKPYAMYLISLCCALLLGGLKVPVTDLKWLLRLTILGGLLNLVVSVLGAIVPAIGYYTGAAYLRADQSNNEVDPGAATRIGYMGTLGGNLSLWISCYISPLRACFRPLWGGLVLIALIAAAMSGFRNSMLAVGLTFLLGIMYRSGSSGVVMSCIAAICGLALLAVVNVINPLPPNVQRALTFLPGTWEQRYKDDARGSSEWRYEIWREVLTSKRWIQNKWLGDGLGFSSALYASQVSGHKISGVGTSGFDAHREAILQNGDYHSGPVHTIRVIGYIGLVFLMIGQIRLAVHAHRQILRCKNTEWFPLALLNGIPFIAYPFFFFFIFGDFGKGASGLLLGIGLTRMLENNLPLPAYVVRKRQPYVLRARQRLAEAAVVER